MSTSDGTVGIATKVVDNGPGSRCWDLVVMGDGYRRAELPKFHEDVEQFWAEMLQPTPPFDELWPAINVHRVDVTSTDSGADMPCNGVGPIRTFLDASYCDPMWGSAASEWLLTVNEPLAKQVASRAVPEWNVAMVLVNAEAYGGSGAPSVAVASTGSVELIGLHELGHSAFGLADEYDTPGPIHTPGEPAEPNVTRKHQPCHQQVAGVGQDVHTDADFLHQRLCQLPPPDASPTAGCGGHLRGCPLQTLRPLPALPQLLHAGKPGILPSVRSRDPPSAAGKLSVTPRSLPRLSGLVQAGLAVVDTGSALLADDPIQPRRGGRWRWVPRARPRRPTAQRRPARQPNL